MKRFLSFLLLLSLLIGCGDPVEPDPQPTPVPEPIKYDGGSGITYQLLVYSFCDSNGDGIGDFNGIASKLDYLKEMGVQAIWLSPINKATSYHGYDVEDYDSVNPEYGTEDDFKRLVQSAHSKGIKIYLDFVLNHTSKNHPWFLDATAHEDSQYRDRFIFSKDPSSDISAGKIPMIEKGGYSSGEWTSFSTKGSPTQRIKFTLELDNSNKPKSITAEKVDKISNSGQQNSKIYLYYGDGKMAQFYSDLSITLDIQSDWGVLVRTSTSDSWPTGSKYGAKEGAQKLEWGKKLSIYPSTSNFDPKDILLPGLDVWYYHSMFGSYMPDINYGPAATCETSEAFKALAASADKWINLGIDGFRLDAVKHIYHNAHSDENPVFLKKFYDHCNATYQAAGHSDNIYMVGEMWENPVDVAPYYKGLPAFFEFAFWDRLKEAVNGGKADNLVATLQGYQKLYAAQRADYINATKLSNHDEDRAGNDLGRSTSKMKLAGAVLLTAGGQPFIYQGEELGYWGSKSNKDGDGGGDEYIRTPMMWRADGTGMASAKLGSKIDKTMLTSAISVESQEKDETSVLAVYKAFGSLRSEYKALAVGSFDYCASVSAAQSVAAWYRTTSDQQVLVMHNFAASPANVSVSGNDLSTLIGSNGSVKVTGSAVNLGGYASAVFLIK